MVYVGRKVGSFRLPASNVSGKLHTGSCAVCSLVSSISQTPWESQLFSAVALHPRMQAYASRPALHPPASSIFLLRLKATVPLNGHWQIDGQWPIMCRTLRFSWHGYTTKSIYAGQTEFRRMAVRIGNVAVWRRASASPAFNTLSTSRIDWYLYCPKHAPEKSTLLRSTETQRNDAFTAEAIAS